MQLSVDVALDRNNPKKNSCLLISNTEGITPLQLLGVLMAGMATQYFLMIDSKTTKPPWVPFALQEYLKNGLQEIFDAKTETFSIPLTQEIELDIEEMVGAIQAIDRYSDVFKIIIEGAPYELKYFLETDDNGYRWANCIIPIDLFQHLGYSVDKARRNIFRYMMDIGCPAFVRNGRWHKTDYTVRFNNENKYNDRWMLAEIASFFKWFLPGDVSLPESLISGK